jgi:putative flippase GtrA
MRRYLGPLERTWGVDHRMAWSLSASSAGDRSVLALGATVEHGAAEQRSGPRPGEPRESSGPGRAVWTTEVRRRYHPGVPDFLFGPLRAMRRQHGAKLLRFGAVSGFNVVLGQTLLFGAQTLLGWSAVVSNLFAVGISAIPGYLLSRYWVWQKRGRNHFMREVVPFWSLALLGLVVSTVSVWYVERQWSPQPVIINLTNLVAFGVVWVGKFLVLDRVLFKQEPLTDEALDAFIDHIVHHRPAED